MNILLLINFFLPRLFGAFPAARRPLKVYSVFDCCARINTMLSVRSFHENFHNKIEYLQISSLVLNLYSATDSDVIDKVLLGIGIPIVFLWLCFGIAMVDFDKFRK